MIGIYIINIFTSAVSALNVAVIVFHFTQRHALPLIMPIETLFQEEYTRFTLVDYAYTDEDKIYSCDMNKCGDTKLNKFLKVIKT